MKRLVLASCVLLLVLLPVVVAAQERPMPTGGGSSAGSASPRGGESGGGVSSGSSAGSSAPSSVGSMGGGSAVDRGGSMGGGSYGSPVRGGGASTRSNYSGPRSGEVSAVSARPRDASAPNVGQAVPVTERPRGDAPLYGKAVPRGSVPAPPSGFVPGGNVGGYYPYYGYGYGYNPYWSWYYGSCGWDYWGFGNPYYCSPGGPFYSWGMWTWPMGMYSGYWNDYAAGGTYTTSEKGSIKLKVKPKEAEVYVDGTYYGQVDHYDGAFQHLDLSSGTHKVEIRANGYQTLQIEMRVLPGKTVTYTGEMKPVK